MSTQEELGDSTSTSPARKSRRQEKEELAYLNDRFASYIEQVRSLKELNLNYEYELKEVKDQLGHESDDIKKLYEAELSDARTLIDETAKEKARQQLIASKNASRVKELETE
jgi:AraC-like DNA-binding protein